MFMMKTERMRKLMKYAVSDKVQAVVLKFKIHCRRSSEEKQTVYPKCRIFAFGPIPNSNFLLCFCPDKLEFGNREAFLALLNVVFNDQATQRGSV